MDPTSLTSLRTKLVRTMVATLLAVGGATLLVVAGMNYLSARATLASIVGHLRGSITQKGTGLVTNQALALRDLVSDNAFGDVSRLVERTVVQDEQVIYGLFLGGDLRPWGFTLREGGRVQTPLDWRRLGINADAPTGPGVRTEMKELGGQTVYQFVSTVVDDKGVLLGTLRYGLSDQPLRQAVAQAREETRRALLTTVVLLLLLTALTSIIGVLRSRTAAARITRPLGILTAAVKSFARGDRSTRVVIESRDEIQLLGSAFNDMATELEDYYTRLEQMNRTLEAKVDDRTRELVGRNRDMRLVLDNVDQGMMTVSLGGQLAPERSAVVDRWFGVPGPETDLLQYVRPLDARYADALELGFEALRDDIMPLDICIDQLPPQLRHGGREYHCTYRPITVAQRLEGLLIVIKDVTTEVEHARQEADGKERLAMFNAVAKNRLAFLSFVDETKERLGQLLHATLEEQRRTLHTLKGNAGLMGLGMLSGICHKLEDQIADCFTPADGTVLSPLLDRWRDLTDELRTLVGEKPRDSIELSRGDIDRLLAELEAGASSTHLRGRLASLTLEPASKQLQRLGNYAQALASRLGKGDVALELDGGGVRLDARQWEGLWSEMVHVVRNAVDHGVEGEAARREAGKSVPSRLRLATRVVGRSLVVEVEDDGGGINWDAVRGAAIRRGLPYGTESELMAALFSDGLSTQSRVTEISGRGIGLGAVRREVEARGGAISLRSVAGAGTCFSFTFPLAQIGPSFGVEAVGPPRPVAPGEILQVSA